jgi:hemoglobin
MELKDIENREDIQVLIDTFYDGVLNDPIMRPVFEESLPHWEHHKKRVVGFWENWLFQSGTYDGGMMWKHSARHATQPMTTERFERWLAYWITTVDQLFEGKNAEFVKSKALEIGNVLHNRLNRAVSDEL